MNGPRRNNSDADRVYLKELFKVCLDDFIKDFIFEDIPNNRLGNLFTHEEILKIRSLPHGTQQNCYMFFTLLDKEKDIEKFLNILAQDYSWLREKLLQVKRSFLEGNKELDKYINAVHELRSNFPKHADFNVHRLIQYCNIREILLKLKPRHFLVVRGEPGYGKKWLILDVCCDYGVMKSMNHKIFWIDVHNCDSPERDLEKLQRLKILLGEITPQNKVGDYEGLSNKILELQQELRAILKSDEYKDCLLVLSDVQNHKTLETFNLPCKIIITTRNRKITDSYLPKSQTKLVDISKGLTPPECVELFERILNQNSSKFPENCNDLFDQIKGHPFLLNIIAQNLKDKPQSEWNKWIKNLENFQIGNLTKVNQLIELSFNVLREHELKLYKTLSIFYHSVKIPIKVLAALWDKTEIQAEDIVKKFDKFSLANVVYLKDGKMACLIHFIYYSYLKSCNGQDRKALHRKLVEIYNIEKALAERTEPEITELPNDNYFYFFIAYHLHESKMTEILSKLYLDFGFLGQKLRATGLPSTVGDLKCYKREIIGNDKHKEALVSRLLEFLPNIEEMIFKSNDTYLLQYALMSGGGLLQEEAEKQAKKFKDKIWFSDGDHFHRRRQMIKLPEKPKALKLIAPDTCLIAMDNYNGKNMMMLVDLTLDYNMEPTKFTGHEKLVTSVTVFSRNYLLTLDEQGKLCVWSVADERRRSILRRDSNRRVVSYINYENCVRENNIRENHCKQLIERDLDGRKLKIDCYYLEKYSDTYHLHIVFDNRTINIYTWDEDLKVFTPEKIPSLPTNFPNSRFVLKIHDKYILLNKSGTLKVLNIMDGSTPAHTFEWPRDTNAPINVHHYIINYNAGDGAVIFFIFAQKILRLVLPPQSLSFLQGELDVVYETIEKRCAITCSAISDDNRYLIVGTKQGIIVFDLQEKIEVLRNSISESITCIDIFALDDEMYKYVIVSGSDGNKELNIFGLKMNLDNSITWANSIGNLIEINSLLNFEPNSWLLGKKLFDVSFKSSVDENTDDLLNDVLSLVAVDSKYRVHQYLDKKWEILLPVNNYKISSITAFRNSYVYGCATGEILSSNSGDFLIGNLKEEILYLKLFDSNTLIAASKSYCNIYFKENLIESLNISLEISYSFKHYIILVDKLCQLLVIRVNKGCEILHKVPGLDMRIGGSDLKSNSLLLGTKYKTIYLYKLFIENERMLKPKHQEYQVESEESITCAALSVDANLGAIGFERGMIEVYKIDKNFNLLHKLCSHKSPIFDMKFSPWPENPTILASISEQICFWDISYIINNPLDHMNGLRHSSRYNSFRSQLKSDSSTTSTASPTINSPISPLTSPLSIPSLLINHNNHIHGMHDKLRIFNPWFNKKGSSDKPELLACVKFVGNCAQQFFMNENFTKFVTIDNEGEYYPLSVNKINFIYQNQISSPDEENTKRESRNFNGNNNTASCDENEVFI